MSNLSSVVVPLTLLIPASPYSYLPMTVIHQVMRAYVTDTNTIQRYFRQKYNPLTLCKNEHLVLSSVISHRLSTHIRLSLSLLTYDRHTAANEILHASY